MSGYDIRDIWQRTLDVLQMEMSRPTFENWLKNIRPLSLERGIFTIGVPNEFVRDWLERRYAGLIKETVKRIVDQEVTVKFVVSPVEAVQRAAPEKGKKPPRRASSGAFEEFDSLPLNPKYTFENFVVGSCNRFAHAAAMAVARGDTKYNPLFIYGGVGLGKTHLMQAIGHYVQRNRPNVRVAYISGETFVQHVVTAIREDKTAALRRRYRNMDLWLVDDIQFIAGKERTEVEFFHTFNALKETGKQIVMSSDRPPKDLRLIDDRLRSRFEAGLVADLKPPDLETRIAILQKKAEMEGEDVPDEVIVYIAERVKTNIRVLEGALTRVLAYSSLTGMPVTLELAKECLRDYSLGDEERKITIEDIQRVVCEHFGITLEELVGKRRSKEVVIPRQVGMYLARELTEASLPEIGQKFGGRDHATVLHACNKIKEELDRNKELATVVNDLRARLEG